MSLLDILNILFKRKTLVAAIFFSIALLATLVTFLQTPVYEAASTVLVKVFKDDTLRPGIGGERSLVSRTVTQDEVINTEIQILGDRELAENVINTLRLERVYPDIAASSARKDVQMDRALRQFSKNLQVVGLRKSNVIKVSLQHDDPAIAASAVNLLVDRFKEKHLALHSDPQSSFITGQLAAFEEKLKQSERKLQEYQQVNKVYSLEDQKALLLRQRIEFDSAYKVATDNISEGKRRIASLKGQLKSISRESDRYTPSEREKIITDAKARLLELQLKEQELRRKYTESNRLVVDARREVELVNRFVKEQERIMDRKVKTGNPVYQSMETDLFRADAELNSQLAKAEALRSQIREIDGQIARLETSESTIQSLKREVAIDEKNYRTYVDTHEDARISDAMNRLKISNISVIESAVPPVKPVKPKKTYNIGIGLLFGVIAGLAAAFGAESIAETFSDPQTVEKYLGLPVLVTIPIKED